MWEVAFFPVPEEIIYSFLVYYLLDKRDWFTINFLPLGSRYGFFNYTFTYFVSLGVIQKRVTKVNFKYFNENFEEAWLFEKFIFDLDASSYSFKITCILSRQLISFKKMVVSSAKFTFSISWSPIYISLIILLALIQLGSTSATIMYKSIENRHAWQTSCVRMKESDRRPFILILDWILV